MLSKSNEIFEINEIISLNPEFKLLPYFDGIIDDYSNVNLESIYSSLDFDKGQIISPFYSGISIFNNTDYVITNDRIEFPFYEDLTNIIDEDLIAHFKHLIQSHFLFLITDKVLNILKCISQKKYSDYVFLYERPYRVDALWYVIQNYNLSFENMNSLVLDVYKDQEFVWCKRIIWNRIFKYIYDNKPSQLSGVSSGYVEVFRGIHSSDIKSNLGFSWTTNKKLAEWFSRRFQNEPSKPYILTGRLDTSDIIFITNDRNEEEIITLPNKVRELNLIIN